MERRHGIQEPAVVGVDRYGNSDWGSLGARSGCAQLGRIRLRRDTRSGMHVDGPTQNVPVGGLEAELAVVAARKLVQAHMLVELGVCMCGDW
jgi:hypothetical protein